MKKSFSVAALAIASMLTLAACSTSGTEPTTTPTDTTAPAPEFPAGSTMAELQAAGKIVVGTKFDQPLFGVRGPDGSTVGFDVEIAKIIADELGVEVEFVEAVSANREPFIQAGTVDIVVATYTINDTRKNVVDFAGPYYMAGQSILVLESNNTIQSDADLVGVDVCTVSGSTPEGKLKEIGANVVPFGTYAECLEPLRNGTVQAISTDNVILAGFADSNPGEFKLAGTPFTDEPYGIGLAKGDTEFRNWINDVLEAAYADGRYKAAWDATAGTVMPYVEPPAVDRY